MVDLGVLCPIQQYFSHIGSIDGWTWKALCNEMLFRFRKILSSSWIRTHDSVIWSRNFQGNQTQVTFLKLISVAIFSVYSSAGYGLCTLTARRRIVLAPPSQALSQSWTSSSLWLYHEQNRGYSSNDFHAVYVQKIWKIGSTCGLCLYIYFSILKSVHMETPTLKSIWSDFVTRTKAVRTKSVG